jgi:AraC-like DNA-binding protein
VSRVRVLASALPRTDILQNNGQLDIDSVEGHGSVFTITLPLADEVLSQSVEPVTSVPSFEVNMELMEGNTILVVDDDPLICQNIKNMLDSYVSVLVANNGREALDVVSRNVVDLMTNYIPILFLSAKSSESDRLLGLLTGAIDYIPKPFSQNELLIKMNNILALRQRQQQRLLEERLQAITHPKEEEPPVSVQPAGSVVPVPGTEMPVPAVDLPDGTPAEVAAPVEEKTPVESQPSVPPVEAVMEESINPMLQSLLEVIDKNYSDSQFSVERLADLMCMTKITLYRRVKSLSGKTPVELLNDYRLNKAHQLLSTTNMPVADVAFNVGFTDPAYFTRRFHAAFHCSPSALRD